MLPPGFCELQVLKLASQAALFPPVSNIYRKGFNVPSFVMRPGDIGLMVERENNPWEGLITSGSFDIQVSIWFKSNFLVTKRARYSLLDTIKLKQSRLHAMRVAAGRAVQAQAVNTG